MTNKKYAYFTQIGVGDRVKYHNIDFEILCKFDSSQRVVLCNGLVDRLETNNWKNLEVVSLMNE